MIDPKHKRKVDLNLLAEVRSLPCAACGTVGNNHAHHLKTRGSGGDDVAENLISLCATHHNEVHALGQYTFQIKYPGAKK